MWLVVMANVVIYMWSNDLVVKVGYPMSLPSAATFRGSPDSCCVLKSGRDGERDRERERERERVCECE